MFAVTIGTEKQIAYANDIIRKPIANVEKSIAQVEADAAMYQAKFGKRLPQLDIIPVLRSAIAYYEKTIDDSAENLTAKVVIESYQRGNLFQRTMWKCLSHAFREAGLDGDIQRVANWAAP